MAILRHFYITSHVELPHKQFQIISEPSNAGYLNSQLLSQKGEISGFERKQLKIDQEGIEMCFLTEEKQLTFVPFVLLTPYSKYMHNSEPVFRSNCLINPN